MITLTIPGTLPGMNEVIGVARANRFASSNQKKKYTELVAYHAMAARIPTMKRIALNITWYEKDRRRDIDNITGGGSKFILDGLVLAGVIPDDNQKVVTDITHTVKVDKAEPRIEIEIKELR